MRDFPLITSGKWHNLTVVLDGSKEIAANSLTGYLDGKTFGSNEGSQRWSHSGGIGLGSIHRGTKFHDGQETLIAQGLAGTLDNVQIFNNALSEGQLDVLTSL